MRLLLGLLVSAWCAAGCASGKIRDTGGRVVYEQRLDRSEQLRDFAFSDPRAWRFSREEGGGSLELFGKSDYKPAYRSPFNIALLRDRVYRDFVMEVEVMSTIKPYPHQDMCFFFGFRDTNHFYYTHLAMKADPVKAESHAHDIFIVDDAARLAVAETTTGGVNWGERQWHKVRLERKTSDGAIRVFFDDLSHPIMTAHDRKFQTGYVGFGSFDDTGKFRNLKIWSDSVEQKPAPFFQPLRN